MGLHKAGPVNNQSSIGERPTRLYSLYSSLVSDWLLIDSGGWAVIVFTYVPIDETIMLQWIVANPWVTQWATEQKEMNMHDHLKEKHPS